MICFKVKINNDDVCSAGIGQSGVLTAVLSWVGDHYPALAQDKSSKTVSLRVGGLTRGGKDTADFLDWIIRDLSIGDEISIAIIDAIECDKPTTSRPRSDWTDITTCSFCGKKGSEVEDMVTGPAVTICSECVARAAEIMSERAKSED